MEKFTHAVCIVGCAVLLACASGDLFAQSLPADLPTPYHPAASNQLLNLYGKAVTATPVKEITWPANPGEAEVCLWKSDKYAAASITIDDNWGPDHQWWVTC